MEEDFPFYEEVAKDIIKQRKRLGGDWVKKIHIGMQATCHIVTHNLLLLFTGYCLLCRKSCAKRSFTQTFGTKIYFH